MEKKRVLVITQELDPYTGLSEIAQIVHDLLIYANNNGFELRVLMPRYGTINERRHRLHEVVRLSGMNIVVNDDDYPLIIKVASLPNSRIQIYFLDNEDFFKRKSVFHDSEGKPFEDNADRMVFFCKGAIETVKKFGWSPDVVHCHGWLTSLVPLFLKTTYKNDPLFQHAKVVYTAYNAALETPLPVDTLQKTSIVNANEDDLHAYQDADALALDAGAVHFADALIKSSNFANQSVLEKATAEHKAILAIEEEGEYLQSYLNFYATLFA